MKSRVIAFLALASAFIGFLDATYLTTRHFSGVVPPCTISDGCEEVLTSSFATIGPIPTALLGTVYYAFAFLLALAYIERKSSLVLKMMVTLGTIGVLSSSFFVYVQLGVLESVCLYCMVSATCCFFYCALAIWQILHRMPCIAVKR